MSRSADLFCDILEIRNPPTNVSITIHFQQSTIKLWKSLHLHSYSPHPFSNEQSDNVGGGRCWEHTECNFLTYDQWRESAEFRSCRNCVRRHNWREAVSMISRELKIWPAKGRYWVLYEHSRGNIVAIFLNMHPTECLVTLQCCAGRRFSIVFMQA